MAAAPILMAAGMIYHPYITRLNNDSSVAAELTADTTRWGLSHLLIGVAAGLLLLAFLVVGRALRDAGEQVWSTLSVPFLVLGSILFAFLPAMEIAMLAVHESGGDVEAALAELGTWFVPVLVVGSLAFGVGTVLLAVSVVRSQAIDVRLGWLIAVSLTVMGGARFFPFGASLYVGAVAGLAALLPLAWLMRARAGGPGKGLTMRQGAR